MKSNAITICCITTVIVLASMFYIYSSSYKFDFFIKKCVDGENQFNFNLPQGSCLITIIDGNDKTQPITIQKEDIDILISQNNREIQHTLVTQEGKLFVYFDNNDTETPIDVKLKFKKKMLTYCKSGFCSFLATTIK